MAKKKSVVRAKSAKNSSKSLMGDAPGATPELKRLESVFRLMNSYGVGEVELEDEKGRLHVRMPSAVSHAATMTSIPNSAYPAPTTSAPSVSVTPPQGGALSQNQKKILSPFVGTFYRAPNPTASPFVIEGQSVKKGQTLCIIEAMKLMNEIESEYDGKIVSVLIENGQPVEFGEPLFIIE